MITTPTSQVKMLFKSADVDADGVLNEQEYFAMLMRGQQRHQAAADL